MNTRSLSKNAVGLTALILLTGAASLEGQTCAAVLQPYFDAASQDQSDPEYTHPVTITFSKHSAGSRNPFDPVKYAGGYGRLEHGWLNYLSAKAGDAPVGGDPSVTLQSSADFTKDPKFSLDVLVYQSGTVSLQERISGQPVPSQTAFQATCASFPSGPPNTSSALLWAVVGSTVYTVTLEILPTEMKIH
jgi:hypothetical protein